jgi:uncharacterized protein (DUF58 family)
MKTTRVPMREAAGEVRGAAHGAAQLAAAMPRLVLEARRVAASIYHGVHGRRRAGPGENFWQYRRFIDGEPAQRVDWRRSAREDILFVREREWEAAHTIWIWADWSPSMTFNSAPERTPPKRDRALVLAFALAELLVRGGERVGLPELMRPTSSRAVTERMAETIVHAPESPSLPPSSFHPRAREEVILLGDLWSPTNEVTSRLAALAANGAGGHLVQIVDVAEETFPYSGRIEFREPEGAGSITVGRAENWAADYVTRVAAHRDAIQAECSRRAWSFTTHRTNRPASEILLSLHARMSASVDSLPHRQAAAQAMEEAAL